MKPVMGTVQGPLAGVKQSVIKDAQAPPAPIRCCTEHRPRGRLYHPALLQKQQPVLLLQFSARRLWLKLPRGATAVPRGRLLRIALSCGPLGTAKAYLNIMGTYRGRSSTVVMARIIRPSRRMLQLLGHYALIHSKAKKITPLALRTHNFGAIDASPCMYFGSLTAPDEMAAVKHLRFGVFKENHLLKPSQKHPNDTQDDRDARSHIILGHWRRKLVATCRAYPMQSGDTYEFEVWSETLAGLPPKDQCMELGRAAIDIAFRNAGLPLTLLRMLTAFTMRSGRRYMVLCTTPALVPFYRCFGFEVTPTRFTFPGPHSFEGHVLVADLHALWLGKSGNPLIWYALFGSLPNYCASGFYRPKNYQERLRLHVLRRLGPVSRVVRQWLSWHGLLEQVLRR